MPKKSSEWFSEEAGFFGPGYLDEYARMLPAEKTENEVRFLVNRLHLRKGSKILDLACGHGRHTIELARRGFAVTGQDLNAFFLKTAQREAERAKVTVRWIKRDMREIPFENEFSIVLNLFTAFGYFESDADHQLVIDQVAKALRPGGRFVIDVTNRDRIMAQYKDKDWSELKDGSMVVTKAKFDFASGRNHEQRTRMWKNGKREEFEVRLRMFTLPELVAMCERAGMHYEASYGDFSGGEVSLTSNRYILIVGKK